MWLSANRIARDRLKPIRNLLHRGSLCPLSVCDGDAHKANSPSSVFASFRSRGSNRINTG
jgi:hypothetical protein